MPPSIGWLGCLVCLALVASGTAQRTTGATIVTTRHDDEEIEAYDRMRHYSNIEMNERERKDVELRAFRQEEHVKVMASLTPPHLLVPEEDRPTPRTSTDPPRQIEKSREYNTRQRLNVHDHKEEHQKSIANARERRKSRNDVRDEL